VERCRIEIKPEFSFLKKSCDHADEMFFSHGAQVPDSVLRLLNMPSENKKFFASFFQKRSSCCLTG
jgi:hypothetical protein